MKLLLAALLLLAAPARALSVPEWLWLGPTLAAGALIPFIPLAQTTDMEKVGFQDGPHTSDEGYANGAKPWALALRGSRQWLESGRGDAYHASARLNTAGRLGGSFDWSSLPDRSAGNLKGPDFYRAHVLGNVSESPLQVVGWGVGLAHWRGDRRLWGGSVEADVEWFPAKPVIVHGRWQMAVMHDRAAYHDLSASAGLAWGRFGLSGGWRAFVKPGRDASGPEVLLRVWL